MQKTTLGKQLLPAICVALLLAGCSGLRFPGVYRIDIEQGNLVDEAMLEKLRVGMTEAQVKFVLGAPQLVDPFEPERWVYLYRLRRGDGEIVQNRIQLWFINGLLDRHEGSPLPPEARSRYAVKTNSKDKKDKADADGSKAPTDESADAGTDALDEPAHQSEITPDDMSSNRADHTTPGAP